MKAYSLPPQVFPQTLPFKWVPASIEFHNKLMKTIVFSVLFFVAFTQANSPWIYCTNPSNHSAVCNKDYLPVCGVKAIGIPQNYDNACEACNAQGVLAHKPGLCHKVSRNCESNKINCRLIKMMQVPSCGFQKEKPFTSSPWQTCCQSDPYDFLIDDQCPIIKVIYNCKQQNRSQICTKQVKEVCALKQDQTKVTYSNGCTACSDSKVVSYENGSCKSAVVLCKPQDRKKHCQLRYHPVCGTNFDGSKGEFINECEACSESSVMSYVIGSCGFQDNSFKLCSKHKQAQCKQNSMIACVIIQNSTPITIKNTCKVCSQSKFLAYREGACRTKICPTVREACNAMEFIKPACAFYLNLKFENVNNDMCCIGTKYDGVIRGKCPQL